MVFVVSYVRKALSTSLAIIRPNSSVDLHVGFDVVGLAKTSPANVTFEWLLSRVDSLMPFQIGVDCKCLVTITAFEGLFTCMGSLMSF
ncbi:unnamed protein product [Oncorhynchus mykiss]|uniref:Uncharacterized protein n=1 Tax=Oncorhynchus mykiss TaxID=8022 RepID=A0A060W626_ONCMY|nr:unnamed protein product [Oncorhynchus mykiss]